MSTHLARARLLLAQSRPADAEHEAGAALVEQPDDLEALALLALSRSEQRKNDTALDAARQAVGLAPDHANLHYVHALVLHRADRDDEARQAVAEALRLNPGDEDHFSLLASIELARRDWPGALAAAEQALALNPEHVGAANLRAMALVRLGRKEEAEATIDYALHRAPDNAFSHANQGWNSLHRNDPKQAQVHFREALRLDPSLDYAREGMLEALKARNPVYRTMLAYFLWMGRLQGFTQWGLIVAIWFGSRGVQSLEKSSPELNWLWWPLLGLIYLFVYLTWTAQPMFNLLLRFNRFGRHVLSPDQRVASNWFGAAFFAALASGGWWLYTRHDEALFALAVFAILSMCLAATYSRTGRNRRILAAVTGGLALTAASIAACIILDRGPAEVLTTVFVVGFIGFQILANSLVHRRG